MIAVPLIVVAAITAGPTPLIYSDSSGRLPMIAIAIMALRPNETWAALGASSVRPGQSRAANLALEVKVESSAEPALVSITALKISDIHRPIAAGTATATDGSAAMPIEIAYSPATLKAAIIPPPRAAAITKPRSMDNGGLMNARSVITGS